MLVSNSRYSIAVGNSLLWWNEFLIPLCLLTSKTIYLGHAKKVFVIDNRNSYDNTVCTSDCLSVGLHVCMYICVNVCMIKLLQDIWTDLAHTFLGMIIWTRLVTLSICDDLSSETQWGEKHWQIFIISYKNKANWWKVKKIEHIFFFLRSTCIWTLHYLFF